ncbi:MAG: hypothetical protein M3M85_04220 [bacterium]|nr:hypothetical protein [bacterium]
MAKKIFSVVKQLVYFVTLLSWVGAGIFWLYGNKLSYEVSYAEILKIEERFRNFLGFPLGLTALSVVFFAISLFLNRRQ